MAAHETRSARYCGVTGSSISVPHGKPQLVHRPAGSGGRCERPRRDVAAPVEMGVVDESLPADTWCAASRSRSASRRGARRRRQSAASARTDAARIPGPRPRRGSSTGPTTASARVAVAGRRAARGSRPREPAARSPRRRKGSSGKPALHRESGLTSGRIVSRTFRSSRGSFHAKRPSPRLPPGPHRVGPASGKRRSPERKASRGFGKRSCVRLHGGPPPRGSPGAKIEGREDSVRPMHWGTSLCRRRRVRQAARDHPPAPSPPCIGCCPVSTTAG